MKLAGRGWCVWLCVLAVGAIGRGQTPLKGLGEAGPVELIKDGFQFVEGPAKTPDGTVYFTDIPANIIYSLRPTDNGWEVETFVNPSRHANGLMYGGNNRLLACQMDGRVAAYDLSTKSETVLAEGYQGKRFNACNDLVVDRFGGIYFTDPRFRAPDPWPQGVEAFYYLSADGEVTRLGDDLAAPNGIILSPDEGTLYVVPSMQAEVMAFPVEGPGKLGDGKVLVRLKQRSGSSNGGGDGLSIDVKGNLYITTAIGIQVVSPDGAILGVIEVPQQPANCTFCGADDRTLVITARTGVYQCRMPVPGHQFRRE
ncbi:MAG: gluconolactonase [Pirellulaceae bacterium]|nr:MAG: gluconolactonase [Pirellulaceae bacterium]